MAEKVRFSIGAVTHFYVPLLLQAFSQSLTYPLVAGIVTHGRFGVNELTAFSQGQMIMFTIGALGGGLVMTGMVFAKTWYGYVSFRRLNAMMMAALLTLQCVPVLPPFNRWLFGGLFVLPPELAELSRWTLLLGVAMNGAFFLRNVPMVVLFNNYESGKANLATIVRIGVSLGCSVVFPRLGWTGAYWGLLALTLGVVAELAVTWAYARPYVERLRRDFNAGEMAPGHLSRGEMLALTCEQFRFTLPLSLGGFLLMLSPLFVAAFVGRSDAAKDMLAIHYVTIGVVNPVAYAALRMQAVTIQFPPEYEGDRRLLAYALWAGGLLGIVLLAFATPWLGNLYFGSYQNVPARLLGTVRLAIALYAVEGAIQAVRGRLEGLAASLKRPKAIMAGQIAHTLALFLVLALLLPLGVPGWVMAVSAVLLAPVGAAVTVGAFIRRVSGGVVTVGLAAERRLPEKGIE